MLRQGRRLSAILRTRREVALRTTLGDLVGVDAGPLVIDLQFDGLAVDAQGNGDDRADRGREADGILQHALQDDLQHALAGAHDGAARRAGGSGRCRVSRGSRGNAAPASPTSCARSVGTRGASIRSAVPMSWRWAAIHQVEQAGQRGIDDLERAPGALVFLRHGTAHRSQRRPHGGERRLEGVRIVLGRSGGSRATRDAARGTSRSKSRATLDSSGTTLRWTKVVVAGAAQRDLVGDVAEAAQAEAHAAAPPARPAARRRGRSRRRCGSRASASRAGRSRC